MSRLSQSTSKSQRVGYASVIAAGSLFLLANTASAEVLCDTGWFSIHQHNVTCGDFGWINADPNGGGETVLNMVVNHDGYGCHGQGRTANPSEDLPSLYKNTAGHTSGSLDGATLSEVRMICQQFNAPPPPPQPPVPPVPPVDPT